MEASAFDIKRYLNERGLLVNSCIDSYFRKPLSSVPQILNESMRYSLMAGGKRIRPILAMASYEACGGRAEDILECASALEVVHTYSLIHDDLPAMDNDDLRRGKPTNHKVYGEALAILAGDALLSEAFMMILEGGHRFERENVFRALKELAIAIGPGGMVGGQVQDMLSENAAPDRATLDYIHKYKTGALLACSVRMGGILYGASDKVMNSLNDYGWSMGLAFQIVDDILDIRGNEAELGKPVGSDLKKHKLTYPALYGIEESMSKAEELINNALSCLDVLEGNTEPLREIAIYIIRRTH